MFSFISLVKFAESGLNCNRLILLSTLTSLSHCPHLGSRPHHRAGPLRPVLSGTLGPFMPSLPPVLPVRTLGSFHTELRGLSLKLLGKGDSEYVGSFRSVASPLPPTPPSTVLWSLTLPLPSRRRENISLIFECFSLWKTQAAKPSP